MISRSDLSSAGVGVGWLSNQTTEQIGPAHDANQPAVAQDRHALDTAGSKQTRHFGDVNVFGHGHDRTRHHVRRPKTM
jgi:hypothetical protein